MTPNDPPPYRLTGEVKMYKNPEPLNAQRHGKLGMNATDTPFAGAKTLHSVPLIVGEFGPAALSYPIIFAGADYTPVAVMSIRPNENLFIGEDGVFADGNYIPAFIRRYPFITARNEGDGQLFVCIDRGADTLVENGGTPLFENGEPSAFTKQCLEFCNNFEADRFKTDSFVKTLRDLDLFEVREVAVNPKNPDGSLSPAVKVSEYFSPTQERISALPDSAQLDLMKSGALQQIHHHWNSLLLWERLINETFKRFPMPEIEAY
jgi:hypothetical protein